MAWEDNLEVCFVGLVKEKNYVWCIVMVVIFMGFGLVRAKRCGGCLKVINWRCKVEEQVTKGGLF